MRIDPNPLDDYLETNTVGPKKILNKKTEVMISKILNFKWTWNTAFVQCTQTYFQRLIFQLLVKLLAVKQHQIQKFSKLKFPIPFLGFAGTILFISTSHKPYLGGHASCREKLGPIGSAVLTFIGIQTDKHIYSDRCVNLSDCE